MTRTPTRRRVLVLAGGAALAGLAGCSSEASEGDPPESTPTDTPTAEPTTPAAPETQIPDQATETQTPGEASEDVVEIRMVTDGKGSYFDPIGLLVEAEATVRFVNDSGTHATAAYHPENGGPLRIPEAATPWESELFETSGRSFEVTLETPGVYDFNCPPHESLGMVGRLVVGEAHGGPGTTEPTEIPPAARETLPAVEAIIEDGMVPGP